LDGQNNLIKKATGPEQAPDKRGWIPPKRRQKSSITAKGIKLVHEHHKEIMQRPNREAAYETIHPIRSKIIINVGSALLVTALIWAFSRFIHKYFL
jgi:hypothetical protein